MLHVQVSNLALDSKPPEELESIVLQFLASMTAWRACLPHFSEERFITLILHACLSKKTVTWLTDDSFVSELANWCVEHLSVFSKARFLPKQSLLTIPYANSGQS